MKKWISAIIAASMLAGSFTAAHAAGTVESVKIFASQGGVTLETGAENIPTGVGKILVDYSENVDVTTLTQENVTLKASGGQTIVCGADVYDTGDVVAVRFGRLDAGETYTLRLQNIKGSGGDALPDQTVQFTTAAEEKVYDENFESFNTSNDSVAVYDQLLESDEDLSLVHPERGHGREVDPENVQFAIIERDGNKKLQITNGVDALDGKYVQDQGRVEGEIKLPTITGSTMNGNRTGLVFETKVSFEEVKNQINLGKYTGDAAKYGDGLRMWNYNTALHIAQNWIPNEGDKPKVIPDVQTSQEYDLRLVYRIGEAGNFVLDAYVKDNGGYRLVQSGQELRAAGSAPELYAIDTLLMYSINGKAFPENSGVAQAVSVFDDMRVYDYLAPQIISANVKNKQQGFDGRDIQLTFNTDMDTSSLDGAIALVNADTNQRHVLTGEYDAATRTYTAKLPQRDMVDGGLYTLELGALYSQDGFAYDDSVPFQFSVTILPVEADPLPTPDGIMWNNGTLIWNPVENAAGYNLQLYKDGQTAGAAVITQNTQYDFSDMITTDGQYMVKMYAISENEEYADSATAESGVYNYTAVPMIGGNGNYKYVVTFDTAGGTEIAQQIVVRGMNPSIPADPEKEGLFFDGWYLDAGYTVAYDPAQGITANTTLYAKWTDGKEPEREPVFDDLESVPWAQEAITGLYDLKIVTGVTRKLFMPEQRIKREEFIKMVVCAFGYPTGGYQSGFIDADPNAWYAPYVQAAVDNGLVSGYADGSFGIGEYINRQDIAAILYRAMGEEGTYTPDYTDKDTISEYAQNGVGFLSEIGVISGYPEGTFESMLSATRAEAAYILYGVHNYTHTEE